MKADALVWYEFLVKFNGECYLPETLWMDNDRIELFTDSSGNSSLGCGAYFSGHWVQFKWLSSWVKKDFMSDISFLELVPILLAMLSWSDQFKNKKILLRIDNRALVSINNKRTSK